MVLRRRAPAVTVVGAVAALCFGAVACTPPGPSTPSPTPTPSASPTETELEKQTRLDFEAAEKAYRTFSAEFDRLRQAGYAGGPSAVMKATAGGPYLKTFAGFLRDGKGTTQKGSIKIGYVTPGSYSAKQLELGVCEDGRQVTTYDAEGKPLSHGVVSKLDLRVRSIDGVWKVWDGDDRKATSCNE